MACTIGSVRTEELDYPLPPERIATRPAEPRDSARLMVVRRAGHSIEHRAVRELPEILSPGDAVVLNNSAVLPARLTARRATGGQVEGLALGPHVVAGSEEHPGAWRVLLRGSARLRAGERLTLVGPADTTTGDAMTLVARDDEAWVVTLAGADPADDFAAALARSGHTPLPPYILHERQRRAATGPRSPREPGHLAQAAIDEASDRRWYQTIYADATRRRSVAAPTAGLHFTPELLGRLALSGVERIDVTLHVGAGTFKPIGTATLEEHVMHREWCEVCAQALEGLGAVRARRGRVVAVGTTSCRTLESLPSPLPQASGGPFVAETGILIAPGHTFRVVDALLTNFHLPRSTLLALVAAMVGLDWLKEIYAEAVASEYRFFSYGDAMLVL